VRIGLDARLIFYQRAGIASYIRGLIQGLSRLNPPHEFVVYQSRRDPDPISLPPSWCLRTLWTPSRHRFERPLLAAELLGSGLDVLHCPDLLSPTRLLTSRKTAITIHDVAYLKYPEVLTPESQRYFGQIGPAVDSADVVIAVSENTKRDLMAFLDAPDEKIVVIPEAPDPEYQPLSQEVSGPVLERLGVEAPYFLFVGTIEPKKNVLNLLRAYAAFRGLNRSNGKLPLLVLAGRKGWMYGQALALAKELAISEHLRFLGFVPRSDLAALYNGAVALVYPSLYEGFGLPVLEAMACGAPVVTSSASSLPDVAGDAAICTPPKDVEALTEALGRVWSSGDLRGELRRKGFARAKNFTWAKTAEMTLAVYERLAG
jgi:glycosyltransferase involved in cell wall biosynthesis